MEEINGVKFPNQDSKWHPTSPLALLINATSAWVPECIHVEQTEILSLEPQSDEAPGMLAEHQQEDPQI